METSSREFILESEKQFLLKIYSGPNNICYIFKNLLSEVLKKKNMAINEIVVEPEVEVNRETARVSLN